MSRVLSAALFAAMLSACGGPTYIAQGRPPFIGVDIKFNIEKDEGSQRIGVKIEQLFAPDRVSPEMTQYVLWIQAEGGQPQRAATIVYDADSREGVANASYPDAQFKIIITAEPAGIPVAPSTNVIVEQVVNRD